MLPQKLLQALLLLTIPTSAFARRGGGDGDGDSDSDTSSSDSNTSSDDHCTTRDGTVTAYDLVPDNVNNYTSDHSTPKGSNPTTYDGSYFQGEATLHYNITGKSRCPSQSDPIRMLGYAWVGPQTEYPKGPENPFIIGFKAWESKKSLEEIHHSYQYVKWGKYCPTEPDLVKIVTTRGWSDFEARMNRAGDVMALNVSSDATDRDTVLFNASSIKNPEPEVRYDEGLFRLPGKACVSDGDLSLGWPDQSHISGKITNTTLDLTLVGAGNTTTSYENYVGKGDEIHVEFRVTFSGTFDSINSTRALKVQPENQSMVSWVDNGGVHGVSLHGTASLAWMVCIAMMWYWF